jgi:hypothetical protein
MPARVRWLAFACALMVCPVCTHAPPGGGIGERSTLRTPEAAGEMETRRTGRVRNGRCGGFLRVERGGLEFSGAPAAGAEGRRGQASQL